MIRFRTSPSFNSVEEELLVIKHARVSNSLSSGSAPSLSINVSRAAKGRQACNFENFEDDEDSTHLSSFPMDLNQFELGKYSLGLESDSVRQTRLGSDFAGSRDPQVDHRFLDSNSNFQDNSWQLEENQSDFTGYSQNTHALVRVGHQPAPFPTPFATPNPLKQRITKRTTFANLHNFSPNFQQFLRLPTTRPQHPQSPLEAIMHPSRDINSNANFWMRQQNESSLDTHVNQLELPSTPQEGFHNPWSTPMEKRGLKEINISPSPFWDHQSTANRTVDCGLQGDLQKWLNSPIQSLDDFNVDELNTTFQDKEQGQGKVVEMGEEQEDHADEHTLEEEELCQGEMEQIGMQQPFDILHLRSEEEEHDELYQLEQYADYKYESDHFKENDFISGDQV